MKKKIFIGIIALFSSVLQIELIAEEVTNNHEEKAHHETQISKEKDISVQYADTLMCYTINRSRPEWLGEPTSIDIPPDDPSNSQLPTVFALEQSYPNPFNPEMTIQYSLPKNTWVKLCIYNNLGQEVKVLIDELKEAGYYQVEWDGRDHFSNQAASGIYFYRLTADNFSDTKRMLLLR